MNITQHIKNFLLFTSYAKKQKKNSVSLPYQITLEYKIPGIKNNYCENGQNNLSEIIDSVNNIVIKPKQIFSFWRIMEKPSRLTQDKNLELNLQIISSLLYYISLKGNLSVLERHHSIFDYFSDDNRIFPLGADAEVFYSIKDLKIKNNLSFPIQFEIKISTDCIQINLLSLEEIKANQVSFKQTDYTNYKEVFTRINRRTVAVSTYKNPQNIYNKKQL